ncbi:ABC transporter ATP-binding protein [Flexithrix dorotheae]|uniref:ABC transporter ATP-binding protein n=1 Tax=Flexithrix dorotheae TaxID=70993 RepID=UPI000381F6A1|nr:ABC transporter ATP-binding protein [Flexithrix dorotheae]
MKNLLEEQEFKEKRALWPFLKRIFKHSLKYKQLFWTLFLSTTIVAIIEAIFPLIWLDFIDKLIVPVVTSLKENPDNLEAKEIVKDGLFDYGIIYFLAVLIQIVCTIVLIFCGGRIMEYVIYDLRKEMFNKLQYLSFSYYDKSAIGWLISRITSDTDRVSELISWGFLELVWGVGMIVFCFIAMFIYNWVLALLVLVTIPILMVITIKIRMLVLKYSRKSRKLNSEITASFNENLNGIEVNKSTVQETKASEKFQVLSTKMRGSSYKSSFYSAMYTPLVLMVGAIAAALVVYAGGNMLIAGWAGISIGTLGAFFVYSRSIFMPIFDITRFYALAQSCLSAGERIFSLIDEPIEIKDKPGVKNFAPLKGGITFKNVDFHYVAEKPILKNFNLNIQPGESIALVGPTGEGKSTIISLISRFYEPVNGKLLIDGTDYRERTLKSFREQLGIILQTPHLFSGTIRDNIKYGKLAATDEEIAEALETIGASEFSNRLDQEVGEEGGNLSIGEKQLISFARTILKDPKILIMDEATSSIDTLAEIKIQKGIEKIIKGRTSIIIAHRLSTIKHCDRILVIKKGRILEEGNHATLLAKQGFYHRLYTRQSRLTLA